MYCASGTLLWHGTVGRGVLKHSTLGHTRYNQQSLTETTRLQPACFLGVMWCRQQTADPWQMTLLNHVDTHLVSDLKVFFSNGSISRLCTIPSVLLGNIDFPWITLYSDCFFFKAPHLRSLSPALPISPLTVIECGIIVLYIVLSNRSHKELFYNTLQNPTTAVIRARLRGSTECNTMALTL